MKLLSLIGGAALLFKAVSSAADSINRNITFGFKKLKLTDFNLFQGTVKLTITITNTNPLPFTVKQISGLVYFGQLSTPIILEKEFTTPPNTTVEASFDLPVENGLLLEQLGNQIEAGTLPQLRLIVSVTAGIQDKVVTFPLDTIIPIL